MKCVIFAVLLHVFNFWYTYVTFILLYVLI